MSLDRARAPHSDALAGILSRAVSKRTVARAVDGGLPEGLEAAVESLSGLPMDDVRVHYRSPKPAQVKALAYAEGTEVHLGPGQEQHLAHEAWHVVQQKQGRAMADAHFKGRPVATDPSLEHEADVMGAAATRLASALRIHPAPTPVTPGAATRSEPVRWSGAPAVLQAKWTDGDKLDGWNLIRADRENALLDLATVMRSPYLPQYQGLAEFFKIGGTAILDPVREYLKNTLGDGESHATDELLTNVISRVTSMMRLSMQALQGGVDEENDHPEEDTTVPEENVITDPTHVNTAELQDQPALLAIIFRNIAAAQGYEDVTAGAFWEWYNAGVVTRRRFRDILERHRVAPHNQAALMQMKRLPNTASGPVSYISSNFGQFTNVTYTTDAKANIDFTAPTGRTTWTNPVMPKTIVKLQTGATQAGYGILNNGVETKLAKAGRSRHNMIATRLRPDLTAAAATSYTWHHRSKQYEMELVDYMVHRKHGHNGGALFWK